MKTDFENLAKLVHCFSKDGVDINHELRLLRLETIEIEGTVERITTYEKKYTIEEQLKYSHAPVHWKKFVEDLNQIYYSARDAKNPKIKIENGAIQDDNKKVPIYEVKPMKKDKKKVLETSDSRNKLEVKHSKTKTKKDERDSKTKSTTREHSRSREQHKTSETRDKSKSSSKVTKKDEVVLVSKVEEVNGIEKKTTHVIHEDKEGIGRFVTKYGKDLKRNIKPPVVLVYADSVIAKDSVKRVLHDILNRERFVFFILVLVKLWEDKRKYFIQKKKNQIVTNKKHFIGNTCFISGDFDATFVPQHR